MRYSNLKKLMAKIADFRDVMSQFGDAETIKAVDEHDAFVKDLFKGLEEAKSKKEALKSTSEFLYFSELRQN